jgi:apolipoprotein D and lipocalin family protein
MRIMVISALFLLLGCKTQKLPLQTVDTLDLNRYMGRWYEVARFQHRFEKDLTCVTATYSLNNNGTVKVVNRGVNELDSTKVSVAEGKAIVPDPKEPGKLKVVFQWPFYGKYWVLKLAPDYSHVVIGAPSGNYLWILSREPKMDDLTLNELIAFCRKQGFDVSKLHFVSHNCAE